MVKFHLDKFEVLVDSYRVFEGLVVESELFVDRNLDLEVGVFFLVLVPYAVKVGRLDQLLRR